MTVDNQLLRTPTGPGHSTLGSSAFVVLAPPARGRSSPHIPFWTSIKYIFYFPCNSRSACKNRDILDLFRGSLFNLRRLELGVTRLTTSQWVRVTFHNLSTAICGQLCSRYMRRGWPHCRFRACFGFEDKHHARCSYKGILERERDCSTARGFKINYPQFAPRPADNTFPDRLKNPRASRSCDRVRGINQAGSASGINEKGPRERPTHRPLAIVTEFSRKRKTTTK